MNIFDDLGVSKLSEFLFWKWTNSLKYFILAYHKYLSVHLL